MYLIIQQFNTFSVITSVLIKRKQESIQIHLIFMVNQIVN